MYTSSITVDQVVKALADFIQPFVDGAEIVRAQVNRVPMPTDPCVVLTELLQVDLETPTASYDGATLTSISTPKRIDIQIDFYGDFAGDYCNAIKTVFRTIYACDQFGPEIAPLYCSDGIQAPLITAEQQWQQRWTLTASLQYNGAVTAPQQFADELSTDQIIDVDVEYAA